MPSRSPSIGLKPTTARITEQRDPGVGSKTPEVDHFANLSRALLDVQHGPEQNTDVADPVGTSRTKRTTARASEQRHLGVDPKTPKVDHFSDLSRALLDAADLDGSTSKTNRKGVFGRVFTRLIFGTVILAIGIGAYAYATREIEVPFLTKLLERLIESAPTERAASSGTQRASLYQRSATDPNAPVLAGTAKWQIYSQETGGNPEPVLRVDVQIAERGLSLVMSMRREPVENAAMSHLIELRFLQRDQLPFADISRIGSLGMTTDEHSRRAVLMGLSTKVASGVFLFGLSAAEGEREANVRFLRELRWMDIPIWYENGSQAILSIEKGVAGERAIKQFFGAQGQH